MQNYKKEELKASFSENNYPKMDISHGVRRSTFLCSFIVMSTGATQWRSGDIPLLLSHHHQNPIPLSKFPTNAIAHGVHTRRFDVE